MVTLRHSINRSKDSAYYKSLQRFNQLLLSPKIIMIDLIFISFFFMLLIKQIIPIKLTIGLICILFSIIYFTFGCMYWIIGLLFNFKN